MGPISKFMKENFLHFNSATVVDAAEAYQKHLDDGGLMMVTLAGAMSTAEMGKTLAEMIRQDKIQIISCTGANLEEDVMNLVAHNHYKRIPHYRDLTPEQEEALLEEGFNRVTDTCIPEEEAFRYLEKHLFKVWSEADKANESYLPHEFLYKVLLSGVLEDNYQIDPKNSWVLEAAKKNIPLVVPGWEDSTMGNIFAGYCLNKKLNPRTMKSGIEYMMKLANWYQEVSSSKKVGFFQIGGGIAGDFPICVVPMLKQDMDLQVPEWGYFCQISDSTSSYGSYSGALPNEKITWGKLRAETPKFVIESDATIVAPLIFAMILGL